MKMRCKDFKVLISASLDGELTNAEEQALERHLATCGECAAELARMTAIHEIMPVWEDAEPSPWLAENFAYNLAKLQEKTPSSSKKQIRWKIWGPALTGAIAGVLAFGFLINSYFTQPEVTYQVHQPERIEVQEVEPQIAWEIPDALEVEPKVEIAEVEPAPRPERVERPAPRQPAQQRPRVAARPAPQPSAEIVTPPQEEVIRSVESRTDVMLPEIGVTRASVDRVAVNMGEAGHAMSINAERVRGNLQRTLDLLSAKSQNDGVRDNGGTFL